MTPSNLREIFQIIAEHPFIAAAFAAFLYFILVDIANAFRRPPINTYNTYTTKDNMHGTNRRGEGDR